VSQENDTPPHQSAATWQLLGGRFALLLNEERAILQAGSSRNLAVFFAHWNCDEPDLGYLQQEKDRRRALVREARLSAALYAHCFDPKVIAADETNFGFFCLFALRATTLDFHERLQTLMTEAGNALEHSESTKGKWCWLHHLFRYLQESESELVIMANERNGVISKVCEASVALCAWLERLEHERAAKKDEQTSPAQKSEKTVQGVGSEPIEANATSWTEIEIAFTSDERVEICIGAAGRETRNFAELGFEDRRNGIPAKAWVMLRVLAEAGGEIPRPLPGPDRAMVQKRLQEIREKLQSSFGIESDPIPFNGTTYKASFKISCRRSVDT
jgi:hypothetical protein